MQKARTVQPGVNKCDLCKGLNHFAKMCNSRQATVTKGKGRVRNIEEEMSDSYKDEADLHAFVLSNAPTGIAAISTNEKSGMVLVDIGGVQIQMMIDSGSRCNIIGKKDWERLKREKVKCTSEKTTTRLYPYGQREPLSMLGKFTASIKVAKNKHMNDVEFYVFDGNGVPLLGKDTAEKLELLKMGIAVNSVVKDVPEVCIKPYEKIFEGLGKLKKFQTSYPH